MLDLMQNGKFVKSVQEGGQFTMPNGDIVSPAYAGWTNNSFTLLERQPPDPAAPTQAEQETARQAAFAAEADPLFFQWQAGEATEVEWLAKRQEIRGRYPYPTE